MELNMIVTFKHKGLEAFHRQGITKGIQHAHSKRLRLLLATLEAAVTVSNMGTPGARLHPLEPKSEDRWAVNVSGNYRLVFRFENGDAYEVDILDYH